MRRLLFNLLAACMLPLFAAAVVFWMRIYRDVDSFAWSSRRVLRVSENRWIYTCEERGTVGSLRGKLVLRRERDVQLDPARVLDPGAAVNYGPERRFAVRHRPVMSSDFVATVPRGDATVTSFLGFWYERLSDSPSHSYVYFACPAWAACIATGILPAMWLRGLPGRMLRARRFREGRCVRCGYDLRASPGRCPECGEERAIGSNPSRRFSASPLGGQCE